MIRTEVMASFYSQILKVVYPSVCQQNDHIEGLHNAVISKIVITGGHLGCRLQIRDNQVLEGFLAQNGEQKIF